MLGTANFHNDVAHDRMRQARLGWLSVKVARVTMAAELQFSHELHVFRRYCSHVVSMGPICACDNWLYSQMSAPSHSPSGVFTRVPETSTTPKIRNEQTKTTSCNIWHTWHTWFPEDLGKGNQGTRGLSGAESSGLAYNCYLERLRQHKVSVLETYRWNGTPRGLESCLFLLEGSEWMLAGQSALPRARLDGRTSISLSPTEILGRVSTLSFCSD